jgi:RimJ/RimL family protein N-acetyltransferase
MVRVIPAVLMIVASHAIALRAEAKPPSHRSDSMTLVETDRTVIRAFSEGDSADVHVLANDWAKAPGPAFDKWPTDSAGTKGMLGLFMKHSDRYHALYLRESKSVIGLLALTVSDTQHGEIGHVILSRHQDNDIDKEALRAMTDYAFTVKGVLSIVTHNAPEHKEQIAPLISLGFSNTNPKDPGEFAITKVEWEKLRKRASD